MTAAPRTQPASRTDQGADPLILARDVLELEARGLDQLAASLGGDFLGALDVLSKVSGRVVVTGMGKSGHVARKIAATFASTGTPALYVHPGEASHGDLGMITVDDAVFALSNSGETSELSDLVDYCRRFSIPLISLTGKADSALSRAADVSLVYPAAPEACPMGLAPTTSTTVMLGMGDALAVTLLAMKGFTRDDFQVLHPGGKLGQRLMKVRDLMHGGGAVPLTELGARMDSVLLVMTEKRLGCVGVTDANGRLAGVITDGDLRRHMASDLMRRTAADVMTTGGRVLAPDVLVSEAVGFMNEHQITNVFVVENAKPVGVLHIHDCLRAGAA